MSEKILRTDVLKQYPTVDETKADRLLEKEIEDSDIKFIVLDDDPTGVQTVHDIHVFTDWSCESIRKGFEDNNKAFYILTNSRGMTAEETTRIHREIMDSVKKIGEETNRKYLYISRSDSTLRGHYPLETMLLKEGMEADGRCVDGEILFPFFKEGGRYTINNIHYVQNAEKLIPAAQTEFAKDATFGYIHSDIPTYIEEKTNGQYKAAEVVCITLEDIREENLEKITKQLLDVKNFNKVCVNAVDYCDVKIFCIALYRAMKQGKTFLFRTAASFVKVVAGVTDKPLLTKEEMIKSSIQNGGIVVVGSHTDKTTAQLNELLKLKYTEPVEFHSSLVFQGEDALEEEVRRCVKEEERIIKSGKIAVCYTERKLITAKDDTKESALKRSVKISDSVQRLVSLLETPPAFVIAKGGITSSDIGTKALKVKCANVMGQIKPGIPVWQTGKESKFPNIPYVIFPGNVGEIETLCETAEILYGNNK